MEKHYCFGGENTNFVVERKAVAQAERGTLSAHAHKNISVLTTYLCPTHAGTKSEEYECIVGKDVGEKQHKQGHAIDFTLSGTKTKENCIKLFDAAKAIIQVESHLVNDLSIYDYMPEGYDGIELIVHPSSAGNKLLQGKNDLTPAEIADFALHMNLMAATNHVSAVHSEFEISVHSLEILNDLDMFDAGEWTWNLKINDIEYFKIENRSLNTGDIIKIDKTVKLDFKPDTNYSIHILGDGVEQDSGTEPIGRLEKTYTKSSPPSFGKQISLTNPTKTCKLFITIESINAQINSI